MNDLIERIDERFLTRLQREMLACVRCDTFERKVGESEAEHEARAGAEHDYLIYPQRALPEFGHTLLLAPCPMHMVMHSEAGFVVQDFDAQLDWLRGQV
jgi:hypothetical protein